MAGNLYAYAAAKMAEQEILHIYDHVLFNNGEVQNESDLNAFIMTCLSVNSGLNKWVKKDIWPFHSEMKQLHMRDTIITLHMKYLTKYHRNNILDSYILLKENKDGTQNCRTVAGSNKQRDFISKEDVISPTVTTESVLLTCIVDVE